MTFREMQQDLRADEDKREQRRKGFEDGIEQRLEKNWEAVNKALFALIVGHAAGLVACMTLLKDYTAANPGPLKGVGAFIWLFGLGFILAVISAAIWMVGRFYYWIFPLRVARALVWLQLIRITGNRWYIPRNKRDWWAGSLALVSTLLLVLASAVAVCKFGTL